MLVERWFAHHLPIGRPARLRWPGPSTRATVSAFEVAAALPTGLASTAGLLQRVLRTVLATYLERQAPGALTAGLDAAGRDVSREAVEAFRDLYPPEGPASDVDAAAELLLLRLAMENPALEALRPLFDDAPLRAAAPVDVLRDACEGTLDAGPPLTVAGLPLMEALRAPMRAAPTDLAAQLARALEVFGEWVPEALRVEALRARDVLREATAVRTGAPGPAQVPTFGPGGSATVTDHEYEAFTADRDWMPDVVMMAKLTHVWLHQLSERFGRDVRRLDQIPDEALDELARYGFNTLWLIGLWERSPASAAIKRQMGNPDALSSAYALYDYVIAHDLGGQAGYEHLRARCADRGVRLASDMVPNHVGIDGRWVIEHPEWFLTSADKPFPGYTFDGPELSGDDRVSLKIEDGYWAQRDAAVVFQRVDRHTGETRFIYHGNDGTHMPWNDTAQLDYLNPAVREGVIQTILHVARMFPVIRFDAAMTLARRHVRRLWHPAPGEGGAIPSRAERAASPEAFDAAMPLEFWREVVDRVQQEAPDTLLLAEAFWMMEGYFVRTLGMHRVYNSAFMNMLKTEDNAAFRTTLKNVLEFSPPILQRFVNFMNNPDEASAAEQFGDGDKYLGVCVLMVTLPGLPMFGHGQIEGYREKYGMEFAKPGWDEQVNEGLVRAHELLIFPLMHRRWLFSGAEHFALFDFQTPGGPVDENVVAFCNRVGEHRALVLYNNSYNTTRGAARWSTAINTGSADAPHLVQRQLWEALDLDPSPGAWYAFRDARDQRWYLREGKQLAEDGLFAELPGYRYHVFLDWRRLDDADGRWSALAAALDGDGTADLEAAAAALRFGPLHAAFRDALDGAVEALVAEVPDATTTAQLEAALEAAGADEMVRAAALLRAVDWTTAEALAERALDGLLAERLGGPVSTWAALLLARHAVAVADLAEPATAADGWAILFADPAFDAAIGANTHDGVAWFHAESAAMLAEALVAQVAITDGVAAKTVESALADAIEASAYRLDALRAALCPEPSAPHA
jgi:glycosidase